MLKPQVYIHRKWIGDLDFDSDNAWSLWEQTYEKYILDIAAMANESQVEMICIGTEIKHSAEGGHNFGAISFKNCAKSIPANCVIAPIGINIALFPSGMSLTTLV